MAKDLPKLSQTLTRAQHDALKRHIPNGMRRQIFNVLIDGLIRLYESDAGPYVNGAILSNRLSIATILDAGKRGSQPTNASNQDQTIFS